MKAHEVMTAKKREVRVLVDEAEANIDLFTTVYRSHLQMLRSRAQEILLEDDHASAAIRSRLVDVPGKGWELMPDPQNAGSSVGRLSGTGSVASMPDELVREIAMAEKLNRLFAQTKLNIPDAPFVYYISKHRFWNLTPRSNGEFSFFIDAYQGYDLYTLGLPERNVAKEVFWTKPYLDAGGNGVMVTAGIPLYDRGKFIGTICIDMLFADIARYLKGDTFENRNISLIDDYNQVVSSTVENLSTAESMPVIQDLFGDSRNNIAH